MTRLPRRADPAAKRALAAFGRAEDGSLTILGLFMFVMMILAGGIALDVMRSERQRVALQTTIDRGVLAASSLDQTRDGETVLRDYLQAAGIDASTMTITSEDNGARRSVSVDATAVMPAMFVDMLGVEELRQPIRTSAVEERTELEVSLVVDISGSMNGDKIVRLRSAASDFVSKLITGREDRTYVSLVPYNEHVNLGTTMSRFFPLTAEHDYSRCVTFAEEAYRRMDLPSGARLERLGHYDPDSSDLSYGTVKRPRCPGNEFGAVLPWSNDVAELQRRINALVADGSTAINIGAKVGTLLLDPSARPRLAAMADDATLPPAQRVDPVFRNVRPVAYGTPGTTKILVVMTDGQNNVQRDLRPKFKSGPSTVAVFQDRKHHACDDEGDASGCPDYDASGPLSARHPFGSPLNPNSNNKQPGDTWQPRYSFWSATRKQWYVQWNGTWQDAPWGGTQAVVIPWPELLAHTPITWMEREIPSSESAMRAQIRNVWHETHTKTSRGVTPRADMNLSDICAAAREKGVIVYSIAFNAEPNGQVAMRDCAGPERGANYFDVRGLDIDAAFSDVLAAINRLRLVR